MTRNEKPSVLKWGACGALCILTLAGCEGVLGGSAAADGAGSWSDDSGDDRPRDGDPTVVPVDPGTKGLHRLNSAEYNATVADVLGTSLQPANSNWRGGELEGFDNMASVLGVDDAQYERYLTAAEDLVAEALGNEQQRQRLIPCADADDDACVRSILETTGTRIFRRPLSEEEVGTYSTVYEEARGLGDDHYASAGLMIQALLSSAEFLYRIEIDPDLTSTAPHSLSAYELASRLSYFLWSSAPDDELLSLAADGSLTEDEVLKDSVARMLADPKSDRLVRNFAGQWLDARDVIGHPTSPEIYPDWTPDVASAAAEEMYLYFEEFLRTDRPWMDFLQADINFVDAPLAVHYGMPTPAQGTERVDNFADERHGFLGLAGFLAVTSFDRRTSPTLRGSWVLSRLTCTEPPPPPPGVDVADFEEAADQGAQSVRERLEQHRADPACANCHALFDPFGMALENFDAVGQFRDAYADNLPIDATTDLFGEPFEGLDGTADIVTAQESFGPCVAEKVLTYALGRPLEENDMPYVHQVAEEWLQSPETATLAEVIEHLVLTETFRLRHAEGE